MKTFSAALRRAWLPAILLLGAALFGSFLYVQKRIPPTATASVAVRDPLTVNPGQYTSAEVSFDSIIKSDRLAALVAKKMGPGVVVKGALSVEVEIPANGINISPLYVVRAQDPNATQALRMVDIAVAEARTLYGQLNSDANQLTVLEGQLASAQRQVATLTSSYNSFADAHGGDFSSQIATDRAAVNALNDRISQAKADSAAAQRINDPVAASAAAARVNDYEAQLKQADAALAPLEKVEPTYLDLTARLTQGRTNANQLSSLRQSLVASSITPLGQRVKLLDSAQLSSKAFMKILVYLLGIIVGLLLAMGAVYFEAARQRGRESVENVIAALGAPALARIPRRALSEVS